MQAILYPGRRVPHIISIYYKLLGYVVHLKFLSSTNIGQIWKSNFNFLQQYYTEHLLLYSVFLKCCEKTIRYMIIALETVNYWGGKTSNKDTIGLMKFYNISGERVPLSCKQTETEGRNDV